MVQCDICGADRPEGKIEKVEHKGKTRNVCVECEKDIRPELLELRRKIEEKTRP